MECLYSSNCNKKDCDKDFCLRKYKLDCLYSEALISESQRKKFALRVDADGTDLDEFKRLANIEKNVVEFVGERQSLYLHSSVCGNGKSSWALRLCAAYLNSIWAEAELGCKVLFISVPRFLLASKDKISEKNAYYDHIKANYLSADVVVWDDIAAKTATDYEISQLLSMIDGRLALEKTNIFTSNLSPAQMTAALGERIASRICNKSVDIELHGSDKRGLGQPEARKW